MSKMLPTEWLQQPASRVREFVRGVMQEAQGQLTYLDAYPPQDDVPLRELHQEQTLATFLPPGGEGCIFDAILEQEDYDRALREHNLRFVLAATLLVRTDMARWVDIDLLRLKDPETSDGTGNSRSLGWLFCLTPNAALRNGDLKIVRKDRRKGAAVRLTDDDVAVLRAAGDNNEAQSEALVGIMKPRETIDVPSLDRELEACMGMLDVAYTAQHESRGGRGGTSSATEHVYQMQQGRADEPRIVLEQAGSRWALDITDATCEARFRSVVASLPMRMPGMFKRKRDGLEREWELSDLFYLGNVLRMAACAHVPELATHPLQPLLRLRNFRPPGAGRVRFRSVDWYAHEQIAGGSIAHNLGLGRMLVPTTDTYPTLDQVSAVVSDLLPSLPDVVGVLFKTAQARAAEARAVLDADDGTDHHPVVVSSGVMSEFPTARPEFMAIACHMTGHGRPVVWDEWTDDSRALFATCTDMLQKARVNTLASLGAVARLKNDAADNDFHERLCEKMQRVPRDLGTLYSVVTHLRNVRRMFIMARPQQQDVPPHLLTEMALLTQAVPQAVEWVYGALETRLARAPIDPTTPLGGFLAAKDRANPGLPAATLLGHVRSHVYSDANPFFASNMTVEAVMEYTMEGAGVRGLLRDVCARVLVTMHRVTQQGLGPTELLMGHTGAGKSVLLDVVDAVYPGIRTSGTMTLAAMRQRTPSFAFMVVDELPAYLAIEHAKNGSSTVVSDERNTLLHILDDRLEQYTTMFTKAHRKKQRMQYFTTVFTANSHIVDDAFIRRSLFHAIGVVTDFKTYDLCAVHESTRLGTITERDSPRVLYLRMVTLLAAVLQLLVNVGGMRLPTGLQDTDVCDMLLSDAVRRYYRIPNERLQETKRKLGSTAQLMAYRRAVETALLRITMDSQVIASFGGAGLDGSAPVHRMHRLAELWAGTASREGIQTAVLMAAAPLCGVTIADLANAAVMCETAAYPMQVAQYIGILRDEVCVNPRMVGANGVDKDLAALKPVLPHAKMFVLNANHDWLLKPNVVQSKWRYFEGIKYDQFSGTQVKLALDYFMRDESELHGGTRQASYFTPLSVSGLKRLVKKGVGERRRLQRMKPAASDDSTIIVPLLPTVEEAGHEGLVHHPLGRPVFFTKRTHASFAVLAGLDGTKIFPEMTNGSSLVPGTDLLDPRRYVLDDYDESAREVLPESIEAVAFQQAEPTQTGTLSVAAGIPTDSLAHFRASNATDTLSALFMIGSLVRADHFAQSYRCGEHTHVMCNTFTGRWVISGYGGDVLAKFAPDVKDVTTVYMSARDLASTVSTLGITDSSLCVCSMLARDAFRRILEDAEMIASERARARGKREKDAVAWVRKHVRLEVPGDRIPGTTQQQFVRVPLRLLNRLLERWRVLSSGTSEHKTAARAILTGVNATRVVCVVDEGCADAPAGAVSNADGCMDVAEPVGIVSYDRTKVRGPVIQVPWVACFTNVAALHQTSLSVNHGLAETIARDLRYYRFLWMDVAAAAHRYHRRSIKNAELVRFLSQYNVFEAQAFALWAAPSAPDTSDRCLRHWYCMSPVSCNYVWTSVYPHIVRCLLGMENASPAPVQLSLLSSDPFCLHECMRLLVPKAPWDNDWVKVWNMRWECKMVDEAVVKAKNHRVVRERAEAQGLCVGAVPALNKQDAWDPEVAESINDMLFGTSGPVGITSRSPDAVRNMLTPDLRSLLESGKPMTEAVTGNSESHFSLSAEPDEQLAFGNGPEDVIDTSFLYAIARDLEALFAQQAQPVMDEGDDVADHLVETIARERRARRSVHDDAGAAHKRPRRSSSSISGDDDDTHRGKGGSAALRALQDIDTADLFV